MNHLRPLITGVLGIGLGMICLLSPETIYRIHTAGRLPHDRHGDYGSGGASNTNWLWVIRGFGIVIALTGGYIGLQPLLLR
jgi:hypothetical protein